MDDRGSRMTMQAEKTGPRAIIVGAGIGGLATAIALRNIGMTPIVYERAPELREVGAGLALWANALHALDHLGVAKAVQALGVPPAQVTLRSLQGETLFSIPRAELERRAGGASMVVHRAELLAALLAALPAGVVQLGVTCTGFTEDASGVTISLAGGHTIHADLLIGADGLHSIVRATLFGPQQPRYAGYTTWRAVVPFERAAPGFAETWGHGAWFGNAPLSNGRVYWFAAQKLPEHAPEPAGGWKQALLSRFRGWPEPAEAIIAVTDEAALLRHDVYDRPPLRRWSSGHVTLLGDAAHVMTPNIGQGACLALEDAVVLARCLHQARDIPSAFRRYETERIARTTPLVRQARLAGKIAQMSHPAACAVRDRVVKHVLSRVQARQIGRTMGYRA